MGPADQISIHLSSSMNWKSYIIWNKPRKNLAEKREKNWNLKKEKEAKAIITVGITLESETFQGE